MRQNRPQELPSPKPANKERSYLLAGRSAPDYDREVLEIIRSLPCCPPPGPARFVGVADEAGRIYRRIHVFGPMEVLVLEAKLNAAGFGQHPAWRGGVHRVYEGVYVKRNAPEA